ncbi:MAG TPA: DUF3108 domain-containing protein [Rhizomicrobium sp.]|nr:DUF3108 domain-containing protein [Rhizomicrobium sp.]
MTELRRILLAAALAGLAAAPASAADSGDALGLGYSIAFWAIPFGHTHYDGRVSESAYSAKMHFETSGVVSLFWKSRIDATVAGRIGEHSIEPTVYDSYSQDRDKPVQRVKVTFDKDVPQTLAEPPYNTTKYPVTDDQKKNAVDPMSAITAILSGVRVTDKNPCGTGVQVFDGRRRYDVGFTYVKDEHVKLANGLFNGNAHLCQIHYNQVAGYKQKIVKEGKSLPDMFVDFADIPAPGTPNGHYVVAVKLWASMTLGTVTATMEDLKVDGALPPSVKS